MREQPEKLGMTLINRNRPNYKTTSKLKHNIMIQIPMKPEKPKTYCWRNNIGSKGILDKVYIQLL